MSLSDTELDKKLRDLLKVMISRLPVDKKLSASVVQQLLRAKYPSVYPETYVATHEAYIQECIASLTAERDAAQARKEKNGEREESSDSDDSGSDDSSADEEGSEDEEGSTEEEDDFDSDSDEEDEEDEEDEDGEEPEKKKARQEEEKSLLERAAAAAAENGGDVAEKCKGMVACLKKLSYRVRAPNADESLEDYYGNYLVGEFKKHKLDPARYGKNDIKHYKIQREVELLQQDGASIGLDKRSRVGRGYAGVDASAEPAAPSAYKTSAFLDDEE